MGMLLSICAGNYVHKQYNLVLHPIFHPQLQEEMILLLALRVGELSGARGDCSRMINAPCSLWDGISAPGGPEQTSQCLLGKGQSLGWREEGAQQHLGWERRVWVPRAQRGTA